MGTVFGKKKGSKTEDGKSKGSHYSSKESLPQRDRAVLDLKRQKVKLKGYQKKAQAVIAREIEVAREMMKRGHKQKAIFCMKKKKYQVCIARVCVCVCVCVCVHSCLASFHLSTGRCTQEKLLRQTEGQLLTVEELVGSIRFAEVQLEVFAALQEGKDALQAINSQMDLDAVEQLMDDTEEALAMQADVDVLLGGVEGQFSAEDERELEQELREMQEMQEDDGLQTALNELPEAPSTEVAAPEQQQQQQQGHEHKAHAEEKSKRVLVAA
jgi:charged multivesicular body protein 6